MYLRAIAPVRVLAGSEGARGVDARVFGGGILAGLSVGLPAQAGPLERAGGGQCVAPAARKRRRALVPVETNGLFSPLSEAAVVG